MTTLNSIIETGLNTSHEITKNFKKTMATITPLFDNMDVLTNLIIFFIFITYTNFRISNMSSDLVSIQKYHQHNIIDIKGNNPTSTTAVIITAVYFGSIINMYRFIPVDYNIIINVIFGGLIFDFYQYISDTDGSVFDFIEAIIIISYLLFSYSYISSYPLIPKSFQVGFIIYSCIVYLFNEQSKNKVGSYFIDKSYLLIYFLYIYIFINNIKLTNSRSKNLINIITIISVSLIMFANYMVFYSSINQIAVFTKSWGQNDESVGYLYNKNKNPNIIDYDFENKSSFGNLGLNQYSASWSNKTLEIRKKKIIDNLDDRLSQIYSVAGPMMIYMIYQMLFMLLSYVIISSILSKYYNPFKLFSKFFVYIYITNVTLFQLNFLIREYNFIGLRNAFYKNTTTCLVSDNEFEQQFGNAPTDRQTKELCVESKDTKENYSWIDLYTQAHISTESKLERINKIGVWITIYSILYFSIVYSCDYLAYVYDSELLKLIAILILAFVIIIYTVIHKQTSTINTIVDMPLEEENSPLIQRFINNSIDIKDYGPKATETYATNTQDMYDIKEIFNNILMMTIIYTIIFYTHRFFD